MSHKAFGPRLEPGRIPLLEEQVATLNATLTAEVLRHAATRLALDAALGRWQEPNDRSEVKKEEAR